jgi:hypothetical protein
MICAALAWAAGLIHAVAAIQHVNEYVPFALFFALVAPAQFAWGAALYRRPGRRLLLAGALGSLAVAALWVVSRTSGLPLGPEAWEPESVGLVDATATAAELVLAAIALAHLLAPARGTLARALGQLARAAGLGVILVSSLVLLAGGHAH